MNAGWAPRAAHAEHPLKRNAVSGPLQFLRLAIIFDAAARAARIASPATVCGWALWVATIGGAPAAGLAQSAGTPAELSAELRKFADECDALGRGTVIKLEEKIRGLRSGHVKSRNPTAGIRQCEADIAAIKGRSRVIVPTVRFPVTAGQIGRMPGLGAHVDQILGPSEMLVTCVFHVPVVVTKHFNSEAEMVSRPVRFKLRGLSTSQYEEATDIELLQVFRVLAAEKYQTEGGQSASVQVLEPFDMQPVERYLKAKPAF